MPAWRRRDRAVVNHRRDDAARTDATCGEQGNLVARRGFAGLDLCSSSMAAMTLSRPSHSTPCPADDAGVFALGFEREEMIERRDAIDAARGSFSLCATKTEVVFEIAEQFLRLVQHLDERVVAELVFLHVHFKILKRLSPLTCAERRLPGVAWFVCICDGHHLAPATCWELPTLATGYWSYSVEVLTNVVF